jgi:hypothetical protein
LQSTILVLNIFAKMMPSTYSPLSKTNMHSPKTGQETIISV